MVGSAIKRQLEQRGDVELVLRTRDELNLLDNRAVHDFFASERIEVYLAAKVVALLPTPIRQFHLPEHDD